MFLSVVMELDKYEPRATGGCLPLHCSGYCDGPDRSGPEEALTLHPLQAATQLDLSLESRGLPNHGYVLPGCSQPTSNNWIREINRYAAPLPQFKTTSRPMLGPDLGEWAKAIMRLAAACLFPLLPASFLLSELSFIRLLWANLQPRICFFQIPQAMPLCGHLIWGRKGWGWLRQHRWMIPRWNPTASLPPHFSSPKCSNLAQLCMVPNSTTFC